MQIIIQTNCL